MGKMRSFRRGLRSCIGKPLAYQINDGFGLSLAPVLQRIMRGEAVHDAEVKDTFSISEDDAKHVTITAGPIVVQGATKGKSIAIVPCHGIAMYDIEFQPYAFSTFNLSMVMKTLALDPDIGTIVLDIDSPGGMVTGTQEAADAVFEARKTKKVVALVNPLAASAAYWIASQASEIVAVPSADVGSIGVFMAHTDCSKFNEDMGMKITYIHAGKYKVEGNSSEPLGDEAQARFQSEVDVIYSKFLESVARGRGTTTVDVKKNFGEGRCFMADEALAVGMIDSISTVDVALARWGIRLMGAAEAQKRGEDGSMQPESAYVMIQTENESSDTKDYLGLGDLAEVSASGCKSITFRMQVSDDGCKKIIVCEDWPHRISLNAEYISGEGFGELRVLKGRVLNFSVENGMAAYLIIGKSEPFVVCALLNSEYTEMPIKVETPASDNPPEPSDEAKAEAAAHAEQVRLAAYTRRSRMLALARFR